MLRTCLRISTLAVVAGLAACSGASSSFGTPVGTASIVPASSARSDKALKPLSARALTAFPIDCTTQDPNVSVPSTGTTDSGTCSFLQLSSVSYGPSTPAEYVAGYHPSDLQSAYKLPSQTAGTNETLGIVVGGDDPNAASDVAVYRATFGLPACTTLTGCFRQISVKKTPSADANWAAEASIDLDMASAICPNCKLLLVEAKSAKSKDLADAVSAAVANGANVVSNSYVIPESKSLSDDAWYHPGVPIVAASGDAGYQSTANWPAASSHVIAVGGTTLVRSNGPRGWSESAWSRSGSACSAVAVKPAWQTDAGCANRTIADVAAVADPATPVAVYDTYQDAGWVRMAGTSVATPIIAAVYALAGNASSITGASSIYAHPAALFAIGSGTNGTCSVSYLCIAGGGYNGPAGLGSPNGVGAF